VGKKIKVVFDTNVWISIFLKKKILSDEFSRVKQNLVVYVSEEIILETSKVLQYSKISEVLKENRVTNKEVLRAIKNDSIIIQPKMNLNIIKDDLQDNKILECAVAAGADIIVLGDKHLTELGKYKKTRILTPREFFDSIT
jgi:uncharacterized protein